MTSQPEPRGKDKLTADDASGWYICRNTDDKANDQRCYWWDGREIRWGPLDASVTGWQCLRAFVGPLVPVSPPLSDAGASIATLESELAQASAEAAEAKRPKMFPLQTSRQAPPGPRQIPWSVAEKAYGEYSRQYGRSQTLERLAERGGFGWCEMDSLYPAWRDEVSEIIALRQRAQAAEAERDRLRAALTDARMFIHYEPAIQRLDAALAPQAEKPT
jgi:hypothetical protein